MALLEEGTKVTYVPFKGCDVKDFEKGIVKSINEMNPDSVFIVFHCNEDWENYKDYTGQSTNKTQLILGWDNINH